jgi:hypothetical protein
VITTRRNPVDITVDKLAQLVGTPSGIAALAIIAAIYFYLRLDSERKENLKRLRIDLRRAVEQKSRAEARTSTGDRKVLTREEAEVATKEILANQEEEKKLPEKALLEKKLHDIWTEINKLGGA